jgi:hypothetical protein
MRPINLGEVIEAALHSPLVRGDLIHANSQINLDRNMRALKASRAEKAVFRFDPSTEEVFPAFI